MAGLTIADSGPGLLLAPHPFSTSAMHATTAGAHLRTERNIVTRTASASTARTLPLDIRVASSQSGWTRGDEIQAASWVVLGGYSARGRSQIGTAQRNIRDPERPRSRRASVAAHRGP